MFSIEKGYDVDASWLYHKYGDLPISNWADAITHGLSVGTEALFREELE